MSPVPVRHSVQFITWTQLVNRSNCSSNHATFQPTSPPPNRRHLSSSSLPANAGVSCKHRWYFKNLPGLWFKIPQGHTAPTKAFPAQLYLPSQTVHPSLRSWQHSPGASRPRSGNIQPPAQSWAPSFRQGSSCQQSWLVEKVNPSVAGLHRFYILPLIKPLHGPLPCRDKMGVSLYNLRTYSNCSYHLHFAMYPVYCSTTGVTASHSNTLHHGPSHFLQSFPLHQF